MTDNIPPIDLAWEKVNALGGSSAQNNSYDQGFVDAIVIVLEAIEALGGKDPQPARIAARRKHYAEHPLPVQEGPIHATESGFGTHTSITKRTRSGIKLFSVCPTCDWSPKPYDGKRRWGDFDKCPKCGVVMDVWTESGVQNEEARRKLGAA